MTEIEWESGTDSTPMLQFVRGKTSDVRKVADTLISAKGVKHGRLTITTSGADLE